MNADKKFSGEISGYFRSDRFLKALEICALVILCFQFLYSAYMDLTQISTHLGYDASDSILRAVAAWEQKTIFIKDYHPATDTGTVGVSGIMTACFYGITGNICLSQGITNILLSAAFLAVMLCLCRQLRFSRLVSLTICVLAFTPYVTSEYNLGNPLDYYACMFFPGAFYLAAMVTILICASVYLDCLEGTLKPAVRIIFRALSVALLLLYSMSTEVAVMIYLIAPCLLCSAILLIWRRSEFRWCMPLWICIHTAVIAAGTLIGRRFGSQSSKAGSMELITLPDFADNIVNTFLGWGKLIGILPSRHPVSAVSYDSFAYLTRMLLFAVFVGILIHIIVMTAKKKIPLTGKNVFIASMCFVNFVLYFIIDSTYAEPVFEERYLIIFQLFFLLATGVYCTVNGSGSPWIRTLTAGFLVVSVSVSLSGFGYVSARGSEKYDRYKQALSGYSEPVVFFFYNETPEFRSLRPMDRTHIYKGINERDLDSDGVLDGHFLENWGDFTYYDDVYSDSSTDDVSQGCLLVCRESTFDALNEGLKGRFTLAEEIMFGINIYRSSTVPDFCPGLPEEGTTFNFPDTLDVVTEGCVIRDGACYTDGTAGCKLSGPGAETTGGTYTFTLNYSIIESNGDTAGEFEICTRSTDGSKEIKSSAEIASRENQTVITMGMTELYPVFEHRVYAEDGSIIRIDSIEIQKN